MKKQVSDSTLETYLRERPAFWRVDSPEGIDCMLRAYVCDEHGVPIRGLSTEWRTHDQARSDGIASGLPEWKPPVAV